MSYSKAYQTVEAGRVREDEAIGFFGNNKIATSVRVTSFNSVGGQTQPTIVEGANEFVGRPAPDDMSDPTSTKHNLSAYRPPTTHLS